MFTLFTVIQSDSQKTQAPVQRNKQSQTSCYRNIVITPHSHRQTPVTHTHNLTVRSTSKQPVTTLSHTAVLNKRPTHNYIVTEAHFHSGKHAVRNTVKAELPHPQSHKQLTLTQTLTHKTTVVHAHSPIR